MCMHRCGRWYSNLRLTSSAKEGAQLPHLNIRIFIQETLDAATMEEGRNGKTREVKMWTTMKSQ
jgi:hypothetical protein